MIPDLCLTILIADDQNLNRMLLSRIATQLGHRCLLAENGRAAVEQFSSHAPDLVLMDVMMPEMGGIEATGIIKSLSQKRWVPVIILSALTETDDAIAGLKAGADDYLTKPLQVDLLIAKLNSFKRSIAAQRQLELQNEELRRWRFVAEDEKRIASHLMDSLADIRNLSLPGVEWWLQAADTFSGDVLAAANGPTGLLHLMLGDGTGHGLAAALSAQPLPEIFYAMTARGHPIGSIAQEINHRIARLLPVDRFFAAALVAIDAREQSIEVWNGGIPAVFLIDHDGALIHVFRSRHLALGICRNNDFCSESECIAYPPGAQLLMMSDGILDACQKKSPDYDAGWLLDNLGHVPPEGRMAAIRHLLLEQLSGAPAQDDISTFVVSTHLLGSAAGDPGTPLNMVPQQADRACHLKLLLNGNQLRGSNQNVMPFLMEALERFCFQERLRSTLFLILSELFNNSLDHGLLKLDSRLKNAEDGFERYLEQRASRLEALDSQAFIEIGIEMTADPAVNIMVHDSGSGFDHVAVMRQITETRYIHGRGLQLIRGLGARLEYPGAGNEVHVNLALEHR